MREKRLFLTCLSPLYIGISGENVREWGTFLNSSQMCVRFIEASRFVWRTHTFSPTPSDSQYVGFGLTVSPAHLRYHLLEEANLVVGPQIRAGALISWSPRPNILERSVETEFLFLHGNNLTACLSSCDLKIGPTKSQPDLFYISDWCPDFGDASPSSHVRQLANSGNFGYARQ